jgi:hypothetical protein
MNDRLPIVELKRIMMKFAEDTSLTRDSKQPDRYLWTDAFAVCNFIVLFNLTGSMEYLELGKKLVDQVHWILGRYRYEDKRKGWISGLDEETGRTHPTQGGLRIGKDLNERGEDEPYDSDLEWDRDGQYYHYLTKWMHALNRVSRVTNEKKYNLWAIELAKVIHPKFTYIPRGGGTKRMYWKMSTDLSYPLVTSMGHHDPLDGLVTYLESQSIADFYQDPSFPDLDQEIADLEAICKEKEWATHDPLGLGGLLIDSCLLAQLIGMGNDPYKFLLHDIIEDTGMGLSYYVKANHLKLSANYRLAFRELGLAIGLKSIRKIEILIRDHADSFQPLQPWELQIESLKEYQNLIGIIEKFWKMPSNQDSESWEEHENINEVMLGTCLAPDGFLII